MSKREEVERLRRLARLLDASIRIPGTGIELGLDALVGLLPGLGDAATSLVALWIVYRGWRLGASSSTVARMLWNVAVDLIVGTLPVAGDVFDVFWKANLRNVELLERDLGVAPAQPTAPDRHSGQRRGR